VITAVIANNAAIAHNHMMALTKVEQFVFNGNRAHFLTAFRYEHGVITAKFVPVESSADLNEEARTATFKNSSQPDIWKGSKGIDEWPLDIIGFDCYPQERRWKFVLNCDTTEWSWESDWPVLNA
jgi:hypothetical protein